MASAKEPTKPKFIPEGGEQRLIDALHAGEACRFEYKGKSALPKAERTLRGKILEQLLCSENIDYEADGIILPNAINIDGALITGSFDMSDTNTSLVLRIKHSTFEAPIDFTRAKLAELDLEGSTIVGVSMNFVKIESQLKVNKIRNTGEFNLVGAEVGGYFVANEAELSNPNDVAILLQGAKIAGNCSIKDTKIIGAADFSSVVIGGQFSLINSKIYNHNGAAINAQGAEFSSSVFLTATTIRGGIAFNRANIKGQFLLNEASLITLEGDAINMQGATIKDFVVLAHMPHPPIGRVDLNNANLAAPLIDDNSYPIGSLSLNHTTYDKLIRPEGKSHTQSTGWLKRRHDDLGKPIGYYDSFQALHTYLLEHFPNTNQIEISKRAWKILDTHLDKEKMRPRAPFAYRHFAKVLDVSGHEREAREIRVLAGDAYTVRIAETYSKPRKLLYKAWRTTLKRLIAYGVKPWRIFKFLGIYWALGTGIFFYNSEQMTPARERYYMHGVELGELPKPYSLGDPLPEGYPEFNAHIYALDVMLPIADFAQESHWRPKNVAFGRLNTVRNINRIYLIFGWLFSTLAIAGMTGLISDKRET